MKNLILIFAVLILLSGCTTVPHAGSSHEVESGVYIVKISGDVVRNEQALKYVLNQFVKSKGHESYDAEMTKKPGFLDSIYEYTVTVPGSTPVEDLPEVRIADAEGTAKLIGVILGIPLTIGLGYLALIILSFGTILL